MTDRLAEIKRSRKNGFRASYDETDWLIDEVERLREILGAVNVLARQTIPPPRDGESIEDWLGRQPTKAGAADIEVIEGGKS